MSRVILRDNPAINFRAGDYFIIIDLLTIFLKPQIDIKDI